MIYISDELYDGIWENIKYLKTEPIFMDIIRPWKIFVDFNCTDST